MVLRHGNIKGDFFEGLQKQGTQNVDPQIVGFPDNENPNKVALISDHLYSRGNLQDQRAAACPCSIHAQEPQLLPPSGDSAMIEGNHYPLIKEYFPYPLRSPRP